MYYSVNEESNKMATKSHCSLFKHVILRICVSKQLIFIRECQAQHKLMKPCDKVCRHK